jgi:hypothetical protein
MCYALLTSVNRVPDPTSGSQNTVFSAENFSLVQPANCNSAAARFSAKEASVFDSLYPRLYKGSPNLIYC